VVVVVAAVEGGHTNSISCLPLFGWPNQFVNC